MSNKTNTLPMVHRYGPSHSHMNILSLALDPLVVPQLNDPFREPNQTYAQSLKSFIDFMHESGNGANPLHTYSIY